ncbi:hypothetical protein [Fulvimarina manganoxydans]|uniref:hypothetical protein n=1 Tax=Fulvimarina manganoxydans TaxID=937218 RepID=UPI000A055701|nr:hypothetical protein [Fulvimarina manganoxydans]MEE2951559.1 hypothetical protein [Pseudomonadota bacterium]
MDVTALEKEELVGLVRRFMKMGLSFDAAAELAAISWDMDLEGITHLITDIRVHFEPPLD